LTQASGPGTVTGMAVYLITYDLGDRAREKDLLKYLDKNKAKKIAESSYAVVSDKQPDQIMGDIKGIAEKKVTVYVFTISNPHAGFGPEDVNQYLCSALPLPKPR
jgi:hypothetical protein